jgi:hypothetical protein
MAQITIDTTQLKDPSGGLQAPILRNVCAQWGNILRNNIPISIKFVGVDLSKSPPPLNGLTAQCIPNLVQGNYRGLNTTMTTAQGNAYGLLGFALQTQFDMVVIINQGNTYNYKNNLSNKTHFRTMILHEICHGLGFLGLCNVNTTNPQNPLGIFSDTALLQLIEPMQAFIPFWDNLTALQQGYSTLFAQLFQNDGHHTVVTNPIPSNHLYQLFTTAASMAIVTNNGTVNDNSFTVFTQNKNFLPFSSCDHIDYSPDAPDDCLMYYSLDTNIIPVPDWRTLFILRSIGWSIA